MQFNKINTDKALTYTVVFVLVVLGRCCCFPAVAGVEIAGELPGDTFGASFASGGPFPFFALKPNHTLYFLLCIISFYLTTIIINLLTILQTSINLGTCICCAVGTFNVNFGLEVEAPQILKQFRLKTTNYF